MKSLIAAALMLVSSDADPISADRPDSAFLKNFATYAMFRGVSPKLAVADVNLIFAELQKPWSDAIDDNALVDRPGYYIGVVRHLRNGAIRRLGDDGWVVWLTVCRDRRDKNDGINCEIQLTEK
jgi:hypothetical protein